jgi:hypothetical protein
LGRTLKQEISDLRFFGDSGMGKLTWYFQHFVSQDSFWRIVDTFLVKKNKLKYYLKIWI